jgi:putative transposase
MNLDNKVAVIAEKTHDKAKTFDYWLCLSTCEKAKPVYVPVESNKYFDSITGGHRKFYQKNLNEQDEISISFIKEVPDQRGIYVAKTDKICVDI